MPARLVLGTVALNEIYAVSWPVPDVAGDISVIAALFAVPALG